MKSPLLAALAPLAALAVAPATEAGPRDVTLVVYDSFPDEGSHVDALRRFTEETGIGVDLLVAGDAGTMVAKAALTSGNPEGDVMWGVDNTYLSRVIDANVFDAYDAAGLAEIPGALTELVPGHEATPVDFGDVCINYDIAWFAAEGIEPPSDLASLIEPEYADLLVVEDPAASSPGLAFLMATIDEFGEDGWVDYWRDLAANGVEVVDGWNEAYYERFSGASDGPRPLVVSYGTSPPAEVLFADPPVDEAPTAVLPETCFRQIEFAGVLRGTDAPDEARRLVDFLIGEEFQAEIALNLFVYPARADVALPAVFTDHAVVPDDPHTLDPAVIDANREDWIATWTDTVLR
jgi:thiamine transport system substrate-binding protein